MALMGQAHITSVALLHGGKAEVVEVKAESGAPAVDRVIGEEVRFPKGSIIGALVRGEDMVVPRGGDIILPGDIVIAFALASVVDELGGMFSKPSAGS
jgi:trk system potassium uptake protein TrkA